MFITKMHLPRRTFLRGIGATLALPFLDAMMPAATAQSKSAMPRLRFGVTYVPNGFVMSKWTPKETGAAYELPPILAPLAPHRDRVLVVSNLTHQPAVSLPGEGSGDHVRAAATFLTGVHPRRTEGADIRAGVSLDQIVARQIGKETPLESLELCLESNDLAGSCEAGYSCAYANTLAWRTETTPLPMENDPRAVFERLFGDTDTTTAAARQARLERQRSLLDGVLHDVQRLQRQLGAERPAVAEAVLDREGCASRLAVEDEQVRSAGGQAVVIGDLEPRVDASAGLDGVPRRQTEDRHQRIQIADVQRLTLFGESGTRGEHTERHAEQPSSLHSRSFHLDPF